MSFRHFSEIEQRALSRHSAASVKARLTKPKSTAELLQIPAPQWLSEASRAVFQSGFRWQVVDDKWPRFEQVFGGFNLAYCRQLADEQLEAMMKEDGLIKHWSKTRSIQSNADYLAGLEAQYGSVAAFFAAWQPEDICANIATLQKSGARLGGKTGQLWLRRMGVDMPIYSNDVLAALKLEGVTNSMPGSAKARATVQQAFDQWRSDSGRSLNEISQLLALSVAGGN